MGQHGKPQDHHYGWEQDAPTTVLPAHRVGPLGSLHARQRQWSTFGRFLWWAFLLPLAIFAWSSWRLRGVLRFGGYAVAGWVLIFGIAVLATPATPATSAAAVPVGQSSSDPALSVATQPPAPAPPAPSPAVAVAPAYAAPAIPVSTPPKATVRPAASKVTHPKPVATRSSTPPAASSSHGDTYTNVDGNQVERPVAAASQPSGATAKCKDGTWSFSQHHSGSCSGHGGVAQFL
jgi:hypothetical protein